MNNTPIVFITDENYVLPTIVAIKSIEVSNPDLKTTIFILTDQVSSDSEQNLIKCRTKNLNIEILKNTNHRLDDLKIKNLHVSTSAILKFELPNIFKNFEKILYLDSDILVCKSLDGILNLKLDDKYAAVVKDYKPMSYNPPQPEKLKINHKAYFNSGVMLLNLKKLREDNIPKKLYEYRKNGINYFMDQDALNVIFKENVIYLSFYMNVISSTIGAFSTSELSNYYELKEIRSKNDIYKEAIIIHLTTKYKPWLFGNVPFSTEWMNIYKKCALKTIKKRSILPVGLRNKIFSGIRVRIRPQELGIHTIVYVNLTSYPARIKNIYRVIRSLQKQTVRVDKIILWLARTEFPRLLQDLPNNLISLIGSDFEIRWCEEDLKPHKKYFYAFKEFPDAINITVDDDIYYQNDTIESLLISYIKFPYAVSANRVHRMILNKKGILESYKLWKRDDKDIAFPSMELIPTGVGGVLYPPHTFDEKIFDINKIKNCCLYADDLWLKFHEILNRIPVVATREKLKLTFVEDSQETALWKINDTNGKNDEQLKKIIEAYKAEGIDLTKNLSEYFGINSIYNENLIGDKKTNEKIIELEGKIKFLKSTKSYKIGRAITYIPRYLIRKFK